jgi:tetratricopeptide (TPR) repeat protein
VHEWTSSLDSTYPYDAMDGREDAETAGPRVVRGGSLGCDPWTVRTVQRHRLPPASIQIDLGFRCIQSAAEPLAQGSAPAQPLTAPTGPTRTATQTAETASGEAHRDLGISLLEHGEYKEALAQFDQALALGLETPDLYYLRSQACSKWPREVGGCGLEQAIADVTKAIKLDPSNREYWFARGTYHLDRANQAAAFSDLDKAVELDPGFAVAYAERGSALMGMGELDRAVESFEKALELDPQECVAYRGLAEVYRDRDEYQTALAACDHALEHCPSLDSIYVVRGQIYLDHTGDGTRALSDFNRAIQIRPNEANYYFERGRAYAQLGQVAEARADYEAYLRRTEGEPNAEHRGDAEQWLEQNPVSARPSPVRTTTAAPTETAAPITAAASATLRPTATQQPAADTPRPTRTPAPTPLPGTEVIPISQMAAAIPWLPPGRGRAVQTISFDVTKAPFNDRRIRQAFSLAVNRATVAKVVGSYGVSDPRAATTFTPPEVLGRDLYRQVGLVYDPGLARELLAEAGYPNGDGFPQVTLVSNRTEVYEALTNTVVDMWRQELGVTVNVELLDGQDAWRDRLFGDTPEVFRVGWNSWSTNRDPNVLEIFRSEHELNFAHFSSSRYDRLIDEAAALAEDPAARQALYIEAERILCQEEAVIIPLYHPLTE